MFELFSKNKAFMFLPTFYLLLSQNFKAFRDEVWEAPPYGR